MGNARLLESASRSATNFMGEATKTLMPQAPAAAEAGLSASSTAAPIAFGCGAGVAAGAAGAAVLQPASAKKIPKKIEETNLTFSMIVGRDYADFLRASSGAAIDGQTTAGRPQVTRAT
jgi:hypothetical protein